MSNFMKQLNATLHPDHLHQVVVDCAKIDQAVASGGRDMPFQPKHDVLAESPHQGARQLYERLNDEHITNLLQQKMGLPTPDTGPPTLRETMSAAFDVLGE